MMIWGTIGFFVRFIEMPSVAIASVRGLLGTAVLMIFLLIKKELSLGGVSRKTLLRLIISGIAIGLNWVCLFEAYRHTTIAVATLCYYLAPMFITLLSPYLLQEKLTMKNLICLLGCFTGFVMVLFSQMTESSTGVSMLGIVFGVSAAVCYAFIVFNNKFVREEIPSIIVCLVQLAAAAVTLLPYTFLTVSVSDCSFDAVSLVFLLILGLVHTGLAYLLWFSSIPKISAQKISIFAFLDPIVAFIVSVAIFHEQLSLEGWIGAILLMGSTLISSLKKDEGRN